MRIQTRIIGAAILVVTVSTIVYAVYFLGKERTAARSQLEATIKNNGTLLKVVTAGPLYDGNVEQLDTILDSLFTNPDIVRIELKEFNGNIRMYRTRTPPTTLGETITNHVVISRSIDELGEIYTLYSTALLEERLLQSRSQIVLFSIVLVLGLSGVIFLVARGLTGPIERLTVAARDMANGHLDREINASGAEELQSLGQSFIRMRDAIRGKMADLEAQNEALRLKDQAIASSINGIVIGSPEGSINYVNAAFLHLWGYDQESDVLGRSVVDFWADRDRATRVLESVLTDGGSYGELTARKRDGSEFVVAFSASLVKNAAGATTHLMGSFVDVTERKIAAEALQDSESRLQQVVSVSSIGIFDHNQVTDAIYWSPQQREIYGWGPDETVTLDGFIRAIYPEDAARITEAVRRAHDPSGDGLFDVEHRILRRDGAVRWLTTRSRTFFDIVDGTRRPVRTVGAVRDITEQKLAEQEREKLHAQLTQAQKMESIGRLAGGVAHDFNNMLSVILGYTTVMKGKLPGADPLMQYLEEIEHAAVRSRDLTSQLLAFSRKQVVAPRAVNLIRLIEGAQKTLTRMIGEDIELRVIPREGLWSIMIDPMQVDQIIMNLAINARDAMPNGGRLTIDAANVQVDDAYCRQHAGFRPGPFVLLTISDNGSGMNKETLSHAFEPFFTTKEFGKGTGLGLATVYGIVKQNDGHITVFSEVGQGTTFKIYLPRAADEKVLPELPSPAAAPAPARSGAGTILLVEDDAMVRELTMLLLKTLGYSVLAANSPAHALSLCEQKEIPIDLLMTDVVMPGMNGKELLRWANAIRPGIRVLFMSGYTADVIAHHGVLDEDIKFIQKPFSIDDLARKVQDAIRDGA
jgi:two-component system, cell cycle sensor histidine kinase and response regulator CckA